MRRPIDDDVIGPPGEFWRLLCSVSRARPTALNSRGKPCWLRALCPVQRRTLRVGVQQHDVLAAHRQLAGDWVASVVLLTPPSG